MSAPASGKITIDEMRRARDFMSCEPWGMAATWQVARNLKIATARSRKVLRVMEAGEDVRLSLRYSTRNNLVWELIPPPL